MTIILYATKYGTAREVAERLSGYLDDTVTHDLKAGAVPDLAEFDTVILGSAVYAGSIRKEARAFLAAHKTELAEKRLGFYLCGISKEEQTYFKDNFPKELLEQATATDLFGGKFDPQKANGLERLIMKAVAKQSGCIDTIDDAKVKQFAEHMA
ncbi:MAG: flavodoxin domain-containing protein [Oscillospiraceae bacterium]|nr:flavodoxin domain-containing protein [Oscillospiraceae bacterium]